MSITESIRDYAQEKAAKLPRYLSRIGNVEVIMDLEGGVPVVEMVVRASRGSTFIARHRAEDMYACIDKVMHKIEEQIRRHKDKLRDHKAAGRAQLEQAGPADQTPPEQ